MAFRPRFGNSCLCLLCGEIFTPRWLGQYTQAGQNLWLCQTCKNENTAVALKKLKHHLIRATRAECEATMTMQEWYATLVFYDWKCAYCRSKRYQCIEHFVSISKGGGTTVRNCVPACNTCNNKKTQNLLPDSWLKSVGLYLASKRKSSVVYYCGLPIESHLWRFTIDSTDDPTPST